MPCTQDDANAFVLAHHRHHDPLRVGYVFCVAVAVTCAFGISEVRGVAIIGRPAARLNWDGWTLEVRRLATDGCPNACSALYAAAWRACRALGYRRLITYILETETGITLDAANWKCVGEVDGRSWNTPSRPRVDKHPTQNKLEFEVAL